MNVIAKLSQHTTGMNVIAKNTEDYISFSINVEVDKYIDKNGNEPSKGNGTKIHR